MGQMPDLTPPEDETITTLFVGNIGPDIKDADIRDKFYSFGEIKSIKKLETSSCAFVTFTERSAAERVMPCAFPLQLFTGQPCQCLRCSGGPMPELGQKDGSPRPFYLTCLPDNCGRLLR